VGIANSMGPVPTLEETYDPKSRQHIEQGTYPSEAHLALEMQGLVEVLEKYDVNVLRPSVIDNCNQVFSRDIGFVIDDTFIIPHILPNRSREYSGIEELVKRIPDDQVIEVPDAARIEGGDVMPWGDKIFVGYSKEPDFSKYIVSRTNEAAVDFLRETFPKKEVMAFELQKSDIDPKENALHLDCCFQPIGTNKAIIYKGGFKFEEDYQRLVSYFGLENLIEITRDEMYEMNSNIFSISPSVIVSDVAFTRLNGILEDLGFTVETVKYREVAKMEGLFRCTTLPLVRD
jgi:N-dimethylarginine dimethylaminohydrolase